MDYTIRRFRPSDAAPLSQLTVAAIKQLGPRAYSSEQIAVWAARHHDAERFLARAANGAVIFIASDTDDTPAAYALLEPGGHLDMLYCTPAHAGRGLAARLLGEAEGYARDHGETRLFTEASELARASFERAGYRLTKRRDFTVDGVALHNYAMEKSLI